MAIYVITKYVKINRFKYFHSNYYLFYRWGQVFILDAISNYTPKDDKEAQRYDM
jgi:hypothetical protein